MALSAQRASSGFHDGRRLKTYIPIPEDARDEKALLREPEPDGQEEDHNRCQRKFESVPTYLPSTLSISKKRSCSRITPATSPLRITTMRRIFSVTMV